MAEGGADPREAAREAALPKAVAVVIEHAGRVLIIRRAQHLPLGGYWTPVTGRVEPGETLEAACHREVAEEVGLRIALGAAFHHGTTGDRLFALTYFSARLADGPAADPELRPQPAEVADARWLDPVEIDALAPMLDTTRAILAKLRAQRSHP